MQKDTNSYESKLIQGILELRAKLNDGSINQRQYGREIGKFLVDVDDDTLNRFDELEQAFDDGDIDSAEYEKRLAAIFPQDETQMPAGSQANEATGNAVSAQGKASEKTGYDVFLSYSHRDGEAYGMEYILRIKEEIEKALEGIVEQPKVFLDAEALQLGDLWHSKIMESINQCKVFICLVSEQYLKSEYSTRERLWWNAKQTHDGRLLGGGPYPVYYVKLEDGIFWERPDVKELMAIQTDNKPWFELKTQLQEDFIRERLASITSIVRKKAEAANQSAQSFCSILPPLCDNFVGRVTELRELHELCANGRHPVIQAAGGVGKTELSVAYAYGFADQYPMGRFLLRMEGVHSWDDAFSVMLDMEGTSAEAGLKKVADELGIDDNTLKQGPAERHHAAADALLKRAQSGKLLILLDNLDDEDLLKSSRMRDFLCDSQIPPNIHVLATTRSTLHFSERDQFASFELGNLKEHEAFEMLCLTGNGQYPFDMQPPTAENKEYHAAHEVIKVLDCHAWSMEIISAFMADNYDPEGFTFEQQLSNMQKGLNIKVGDCTFRSGTATPEALLQPTLEKLSSQELGAENMELLTFASCFNADNIPVNILEAYWQKYYPDVECSKGKPFVFALKQLTKYHLLSKNEDTCKMHRLLQSVLLKNVKPLVRKFGVFLQDNELIHYSILTHILKNVPELINFCNKDKLSPTLWIFLLSNSYFVPKCPWDDFNGDIWSKLLQQQPKYAERCEWGKLNGSDWSSLLQKQPQFAEKCLWDKLDGNDWSSLLRKQPQFAEKCPWNKLGAWAWSSLLQEQPQFAEKCPWSKLGAWLWFFLLQAQPQFAEKCPWDKLDAEIWSFLLQAQPQFAEKCPWDKLEGEAWSSLLQGQPQFAEKCPWNKLGGMDWSSLLQAQPQFADRCPWDKLDGEDWSSLLQKQPQFADICPWDKLNGKEWSLLLQRQVQFSKRCSWDKMDGNDWVWLLQKQPQFSERCPWYKLDGHDWSWLLKEQPQFSHECPWRKLDGNDWGSLLLEQPQFAEKCSWDKLEGSDWSNLLLRQPQFAEECPWLKLEGKDWSWLLQNKTHFADKCLWDRLEGKDWSRLLCVQPQFAEKCTWDKLGGNDWSRLLCGQPQFADKCPWDKLGGYDWSSLLCGQPQFAEKCPWDKLDGNDWCSLLQKQPQFVDKCPWDKLDGYDWSLMLCESPQFADRCPWDKLDGNNWISLLQKQASFADRCPWDILNGYNWSQLLQKQPQFADRCPWNKLDGNDWSELLQKQLQFAEKCPWDKLEGSDWVELLKTHPQFADKCPWDKLDGSDWSLLLCERPQFAEKCPWDKLSDFDWSCLLMKQPQFAEKCSFPWKKLAIYLLDNVLYFFHKLARQCLSSLCSIFTRQGKRQ